MAQPTSNIPLRPVNDADDASGFNRKYLRVADLRRLRHLGFAARRPVEGLYAGRHRSPQRGHSVEFVEHRQYMPGDEVADVDWKVFGRSDKLFVKLFEHQSDMVVSLLVDGSASMGYAGDTPAAQRLSIPSVARPGKVRSFVNAMRGKRPAEPLASKFDHACLMAAAIAFLTTKQQDKVAFALAQDGLASYHRPGSSFKQLTGILDAMESARPRGGAKLAQALEKMAPMTGRRGLLVILSDLLDDREGVLRALAQYLHRGTEVIVFHTLHADELKLPDASEAVFTDSETAEKVALNVDDIRPAYEQKLKDFLQGWTAACRARRIDYNLVSTGTSYYQALEQYLFARASMG